MKRTFEVQNLPRGMIFDKEIEEEDGTELVSRPGTVDTRRTTITTGTNESKDLERGLESQASFENIDVEAGTRHLGTGLDKRKSSARSVNEGELMSPRSPGWV